MNTDAIAKRVAWIACCVLTATVCAMPTKQQLTQAQQLVNDLTADDLRALKSKEKTPGDVAAAHLALADKADTEAGKYLLLQGAFRLYARSGDYDAAAATLQRMRGEIAGLPPEVIVEIVNNEMRRVAASKAPKVLAIFRDAQRMIKYRKQLAAAELDAMAHPESARYQRRVAECHACLGDWQKALPIFAKLGDVAAKWEFGTAKDCDAAKAADFWWNYKAADVEPFKAHAASLYRAALDANQVSGLRREVAAKRLAEFEASGVTIPAAATGATASASAVSAGAQKAPAPTTGPWAIPANFKTPLVRTLKLADGVDMDFCAVPAGSFKMSYAKGSEQEKRKDTHKVTITRPFWFSKTLVTTKQYRELKPSAVRDAQCKEVEALFPGSDVVHSIWGPNIDAAIEKLNMRFKDQLPQGYVFRLPTEAEWEYAICAAGRQSVYDMKYFWVPYKHSHDLLDSKKYDKDKKEGYAALVLPRSPANKLGIIGAGTDIPQPVIDSIDAPNDGSCNAGMLYEYNQEEIDPLRIGGTRLQRHGKNGRWNGKVAGGLFRVVIGPDLVAEKMAAQAGKAASSPILAPPTVHSAQNATQSAQVKTHTIKLNNTVNMDFVECPAGTFTMGFATGEHDVCRRHKVTITRPFWIAKTKLTLGQYKTWDRNFRAKEEMVLGDEKVPLLIGFFGGWPNPMLDKVEQYCEYLTKKFRASIPKGYVFRLPTEAEWEYAYVADETAPDDFYAADGNLMQIWPREQYGQYMFDKQELIAIAKKLGKKEKWESLGVPVGQLKPNRWGLYDMAGNSPERMLDIVDDAACNSGWAFDNKTQTALVYADEEVDPLRMSSAAKTTTVARGGDMGKWYKRKGGISCRLVVGPDLVAEKKKAGRK